MKTVLTAAEVAKALRISESKVSREARKGNIPGAHRIGGQWRFTEEVIDRWLSEEIPPTRAKSLPRRRKQKSRPMATTVQRSTIESSQLPKISNENNKAHGTASPANEL